MDIEDWYQANSDRANFLFVYIEEAHPTDGWLTPDNVAAGILVEQPENDAERQELAEICTTSLEITIPTVIDKIDNGVEIAYAGYPDRIFILDTDGIVRFKTKPGPRGFRPEEAIEALTLMLE